MGRPGRRLGAGALAALAGALAAGGARAFEQKEFKVRAAGFPPPPPRLRRSPPARPPARPACCASPGSGRSLGGPRWLAGSRPPGGGGG